MQPDDSQNHRGDFSARIEKYHIITAAKDSNQKAKDLFSSRLVFSELEKSDFLQEKDTVLSFRARDFVFIASRNFSMARLRIFRGRTQGFFLAKPPLDLKNPAHRLSKISVG